MALADWLAFNRLPGVGQRGRLALLAQFDQPARLFAAGSGAWRAAGLGGKTLEALQGGPAALLTEDDRAWLAQADTEVLTWNDPDYPPLLREVPDAPVVLYLRGRRELLGSPMLGVVGSRSPTPSGAATAQAFAEHLSLAGLSIVSGLAAGIDAAAHRGALAGSGRTIAVMGTGPDRIYPRQHHELARQIAATGLLISDYPPGTPVRASQFPQRNRIISGLSYGVLVVEAALQSGSLITARLAAEQGREVFAIPGSIHSPLSRGPHKLLREGAKLVETAQDVLEELGPLHGALQAAVGNGPAAAATAAPTDPEQAQLLGVLAYDPQPFDLIVKHSGLTPDRVSAMLLNMELDGWVASCPGGRYCRVPRGA